jgi:type I restriction enzyme M protein
MNARISQQQLESYLWGAATLLRGTIDAGDYKQFIFPLLFFKRLCDVFDEETQSALRESGGDKDFAAFPENHRFQIPGEAHWREVRRVAKNVGKAIQSAMRTIETANPDKLYGIFGDAQWTNKDRLSDAMLRDLIEHFSSLELSLGGLPEDELGQGYEYLIKKFADDSGHTAAEFYTNRTVVHLMTDLLEPQPGESIYDPTCGSGGMLLSCITHIRRQAREWRNVRLYGQERNLMTSSIARMNCFLHGIEDFQIVRGDTLSEPKFVQGDHLMRFDVVLANPPYSIKQWSRDAFASDPWGRNLYGTPPQGRADYAFWQHILCSLAPKTGRCAILFPHGVLFRQEEAEMRRKLIEVDLIDCVLGLGPNLFYNSPMEACIVICRTAKSKARKGRILFINAVHDVTRERAQTFLTGKHIARIVAAYRKFGNVPGLARSASLEEIRKQDASLSISRYVAPSEVTKGNRIVTNGSSVAESMSTWIGSLGEVRSALNGVLRKKLASEMLPSKVVIGDPAWLKRKDWKRIKFGAFADSVNERIEPADAANEIYVGLDDLDPESLHIRRWGKGSDVIGTKLRFSKGDVIFGRRRAYQRKLAVAEMDGICSAHAMVVRAKPDAVLPEFLPFLMMSDQFMNRAVEISVGSLSPTINWRTLEVQEFEIPPFDQQRRIAAIARAVDEVESNMSGCAKGMTDLFHTVANERFRSLRKSAASFVPLTELCIRQPQSGLYKGAEFVGRGVKTVNMGELFGHDVIEQKIPMRRMELSLEEIERFSLTQNDLLFGRRSIVLEGAGKCSMVGVLEEPTIFESSILRVTIDSTKALPSFIFAWLNSPEGHREIARITSFTTVAGISGSALRQVSVPLIPVQHQLEIVAEFENLRARKKMLNEACATVRSLRVTLNEAY